MDFSEELIQEEEQYQQGQVKKNGDLLSLAKDFKAAIGEELKYIQRCEEGTGYSEAETSIKRLYEIITHSSPFIKFWNANAYLKNSKEMDTYMNADDGIDKIEKRNVQNMVGFMKQINGFHLDLMAFFQDCINAWFKNAFKLFRADAELRELLNETSVDTISDAFTEFFKIYDSYYNYSAYRKKFGRTGNEHLDLKKDDVLAMMHCELDKTRSLKDFMDSPEQVNCYALNFLSSVDLKTFAVSYNYRRNKSDYEAARAKLEAINEESRAVKGACVDEATTTVYNGLRSIYLEFAAFFDKVFKIFEELEDAETAPYRIFRLEKHLKDDAKRCKLGDLYGRWEDGTNFFPVVKNMGNSFRNAAIELQYYNP